ncbi:Cell division ATP-binding protein FtsE [Hondaea fermentalgiana]|uniref:Cell division ATP-binding protein FtsE n=1 Tax=Hondaea fermentalgiana TaxID=2315210 RepID=A0A2R5GJI0_9STRA|nr:Cell division ATP-binding protein FtsE [Hondaea fermentalgiana]|eukprot:GBG28014.1 Cell division ATP-binding protein FtsE [Hondaea fermentalgiana]
MAQNMDESVRTVALAALTKKELRSVLTELGMSAAGSKTDLASRMTEALPSGANVRLRGLELVAIENAEGNEIPLEDLRQPVRVELEPPPPVRDPAECFPGAKIVRGEHHGRVEGFQQVQAVPRGSALTASRKRPRKPDASTDLSTALAGRKGGCVVAIVGDTGAGKTRLLLETPETSSHLEDEQDVTWNSEQAIVSQFGSVEEASTWLLAVGLTSIPSWCKPHHILSTGERYRAVMARMLQKASSPSGKGILVLDNFTNQLDRNTARACSAALSKLVRKLGIVCVVSTALMDTVEWLMPEEIFSCVGCNAGPKRCITSRSGDFVSPKVRICISDRFVIKSLRAGEPVPEDSLADADLPSRQAERLKSEFQYDADDNFAGTRTGEGGAVLVTKVSTDDATLSCDRLFDSAFDGQCMMHVPARETVAPLQAFSLGVITGMSGSAKSVLLRHHFGPPTRVSWAETHSVAAHFASAHEATRCLGLVFLDADKHGSQKYSELSTGEQELANLARVLDLRNVYLDEFTSALDRKLAVRVARAVADHLKSRDDESLGWVVVSCHADVLGPLSSAAQWMYDTWRGRIEPSDAATNDGSFCDEKQDQLAKLDARGVVEVSKDGSCGILRRPSLGLRLSRCEAWLWALFRDHHYKTKSLSRKSRCFVLYEAETGSLVGFVAAIQQVGTPHQDFEAGSESYTATWRAHRTVVLPAWQGLGIGSRLSDACAEVHRRLACMYMAQTVHPRFGEYRDRSVLWEAAKWNHSTRAFKIETWKQRLENKRIKLRIPRYVYAHVYKGPGDDEKEAVTLAAERVAFVP